MGALTPGHLIVILVIALIVIGPGKLPEVGAALGKSFREFQKATGSIKDSVDPGQILGTQAQPPAQVPMQPMATQQVPQQVAPMYAQAPMYAPQAPVYAQQPIPQTYYAPQPMYAAPAYPDMGMPQVPQAAPQVAPQTEAAPTEPQNPAN